MALEKNEKKFGAAFQEFDRAAHGLDGHTGEGRFTLAIRSLYLAEAQILYANIKTEGLSKELREKIDGPRKETKDLPRTVWRKAFHYMERARRALDDAESLLSEGRRDMQTWYLLHRLRAQAHFETLVMLLGFGPNMTEPESLSRFSPEMTEHGRTSFEATLEAFEARLFDEAYRGLRAIRDTRDNLLHNVPLDEALRVIDLRRVYCKILLTYACNRLALELLEKQQGSSVKTDAFVEDFWETWIKWSKPLGLNDLEDQKMNETVQECKGRLKRMIDSLMEKEIMKGKFIGPFMDDRMPWYDLRLMSSVNDVSGIPTEGERLIVVAAVHDVLHFRIFDGDGKMVVDTDESA